MQGKLGVAVSNLFFGIGDPSDLDVFSYFAFDTELRRFYGKGKDFNAQGDGSVIEVLAVFTENPPAQYAVNGTTCKKSNLEMVLIACIPDDAYYAGTVRLAMLHANHIKSGVYLSREPWVAKPSDREDETFHIVMEDDCTPVVYRFEGTNSDGGDTIYTTVYGDYEPKVDYPSVFEIPDICK